MKYYGLTFESKSLIMKSSQVFTF